jgi:catechol 2,3-dioxygenase-like lactoylglutathione lyase family enzyme
MSQHVDKNELHGIQPVHRVHDVHASVAYYRDVLGFEVDFVHGEPAVHARVSSGDRESGSAVRIRLEKLPVDSEARVGSDYCYIHVAHDLDGLYELYRSRGVAILQEPQNHAWGLRDFYIRDCDGYVFCFAGEVRDVKP